MLDNKESRQRVYAMFTAKFLTLQEVQKTVVRSQYLWTVRVRRSSCVRLLFLSFSISSANFSHH
jgi:hypothetical protein